MNNTMSLKNNESVEFEHLYQDFQGGITKINTIVGPCALESEEQFEESVHFLTELGYKYIRAGVYKPRTSPHNFQGLGPKGVNIVQRMKDKYDFKSVIEVMSVDQYFEVAEVVDIIQVGSRNMQNFELLKFLSTVEQPVLLKRGLTATYSECIGSINYLRQNGKKNIIFCERGIRTFTDYTRNTLDIMSVPIISEQMNIPVIVDCSHSTGRRNLIDYAVKAAIGVEAHGLMIEVHPDPSTALSDNEQQLNFTDFKITNELIGG